VKFVIGVLYKKNVREFQANHTLPKGISELIDYFAQFLKDVN
jgi:hypothetical protein